QETAQLTWAMARSGEMVDLSSIAGVKVDKHSTGGVADTTTLVVAPMVAACGLPVVKMSGRGLGHTGGTVDKLESVPGVRAQGTMEEFLALARRTGLAVVGQSAELAPADKRMYALRDVTATVDSIPLIASSIMSKKLAAGCDAIVLDVKCGSGAFMESREEAQALARAMVAIGRHAGRNTVAIVSDMSQPLGRAVGNALEVAEALELLEGKHGSGRLMQMCCALGEQMLLLGGAAQNREDARSMLQKTVSDGSARAKLLEMLAHMGAEQSFLDAPGELVQGVERVAVPALRAGWVTAMDTKELGRAAQILGAGRLRKEDVIDPMVGYVMAVSLGDHVEEGQPLATLFVRAQGEKAREAAHILTRAVTLSDTAAQVPPLVYATITQEEAI
ncbi:MAG: thymidine phosphorylase, partial [Eubacteriales bacterium]|nr:thymidine phosphorylase [Eubacteriales bacterium]